MKYRHALPQLADQIFLTDGGMETTLVFIQGVELPYFAAFDQLCIEPGRQRLQTLVVPHTNGDNTDVLPHTVTPLTKVVPHKFVPVKLPFNVTLSLKVISLPPVKELKASP